jgi:hypothetical protein
VTILTIAEPTSNNRHKHLQFVADVVVLVVTKGAEDPTVLGYVADVSITCAGCGERFIFEGGDQAPEGSLPVRPTVSTDALELRAPIRPSGFAWTPTGQPWDGRTE